MAAQFDSLVPPYTTIVADPPWHFPDGQVSVWDHRSARLGSDTGTKHGSRNPMPYLMMSVEEITALPVAQLAAPGSELYLWTTNRHLEQSFAVARAWGFRPTTTLVWCKIPKGIGPGGRYSITTEFVLFCRRAGQADATVRAKRAATKRVPSTWYGWPRGPHSVKPPAFYDLVESVSPGPYLELFARGTGRSGWDVWGDEAEVDAA